MLLRHWTDEDIQRYLDGEISQYDSILVRHLHTCKSCRDELAQYRLLYRLLKKEPEFCVSEHFARETTVKAERHHVTMAFWRRESVLISTGLAGMLSVWFYACHPASLYIATKGLMQTVMELKNISFSWIHLSDSFPLILAGGGILILASLFDRYILQPRLRRLFT